MRQLAQSRVASPPKNIVESELVENEPIQASKSQNRSRHTTPSKTDSSM
jgi:hypothetical protein